LSNSYSINNILVVDNSRNLANLVNVNSVGTGFTKIPSGTTGERPGTPVAGMFRYNTTENYIENYISSWGQLGAEIVYDPGGLTSSPKQVIYKEKTDTQNITSNTFIDITSLTGNIRPYQTTSKVRITSALNISAFITNTNPLNYVIQVGLFRGSTQICTKTQYFRTSVGHGNTGFMSSLGSTLSFEYIDSPGTRQTVNYNLKFRLFRGATTITAAINTNRTYTGTPQKSTMILEDYTY
jgi:hypothetical protein